MPMVPVGKTKILPIHFSVLGSVSKTFGSALLQKDLRLLCKAKNGKRRREARGGVAI
jgi:hypothetical protein